MTEPRTQCPVCWQDWLHTYRNTLDGRLFMLCPECDSVWYPGDDTSRSSGHSLAEMFAGTSLLPGQVDWDFIEPVDPA